LRRINEPKSDCSESPDKAQNSRLRKLASGGVSASAASSIKDFAETSKKKEKWRKKP
jgi:hypothetical protein